MKITSAKVHGFRLLDGVTISFEEDTTIVVGRNNSGKTSLVEVFYKFLGPSKSVFTLDDFSLSNVTALREAGELWQKAIDLREAGKLAQADAAQKQAAALIPSIRLDLEFEYGEDDHLAPIAELVLDLDSSRHDALLSCRYEAERSIELLTDFSEATPQGPKDIVEFVRKRMSTYFRREFVAIDRDDPKNVKELDASQASTAVLCDFIYAQNLFDDTSGDTGHGLSKGFEDYYNAISTVDGTVDSLEAALAGVSATLDGEYSALFAGVFGDLKQFGAGAMTTLQELKVVSSFKAADLLKGSTRVMYAHGSGVDLPEAHNGLGFSKLIFIILQFVAFFEAYQKRQPRSGVQLLFLEEPEAHLHPQMQAVFIKNVTTYLKSKPEWNVQLVITTHSSHVVAESGFSCLRYFDASSGHLEVRDLNAFRHQLESTDEKSLDFLRQYMELHRCDLFFADKAILVEGATERLVLPSMVRQVAPGLLSEYVSVIEVGGAYAVKFKALIEFLKIKTLIITDIDSAELEGRHKKTATDTLAAITTNVTLKSWLPGLTEISELLAASDADKVSESVRVAYQVPETNGSRTGRSFEEAFILGNAQLLSNSPGLASAQLFQSDDGKPLSTQSILQSSYEIAGRIKSKSDFAFDIVSLGEWSTPRYIGEGLKWLQRPSK